MPAFDATELDGRENARIVKSAVTPRPIAWVSTVNESGVDNLAPYSSYNYITSSSPVVVFNASRKNNGELKDSARNALDTGEFAVNVVTEPLIAAMDQTSEALPPEESEFDHVDIARAPCVQISAPRVANAAITFECTLYDSKKVYEKMMVFGEIVQYHVSERVMTDGEIDMRKINTVGRLGGPYYTSVNRMDIDRQF